MSVQFWAIESHVLIISFIFFHYLTAKLQREQAHVSGLFEANLGMLVTGFPDMSANLENLQATLPSLTRLLCKDVGECGLCS